MKNGIRAVIFMLVSTLAALFAIVVNNVWRIDTSDLVTVEAVQLTSGAELSSDENVNMFYSSRYLSNISNDVVKDSSKVAGDFGFVTLLEDTNIVQTVGSIDMKVDSGWITTDPINVDVNALRQAYTTEYPTYSWDVKNKINTIYLLHEFLVNQNGVNENIACAIIGATMNEGYIGQKESSNSYIDSIESARSVLGSGTEGYGLAQWTFSTRQKALLEYYEMCSCMFDDFADAQMVAECCMLLEEVKAYNVFPSFDENISIEQATGRMCKIYERYQGVDSQWSSNYELISNEGSGWLRLEYAYAIYNLFKE